MKVRESNNTIVGIDNWYESTVKFINEELGLMPKNDKKSMSKIDYSITDSNEFSRVYSKLNKSLEFSYVDNESAYSNNSLTLVFICDKGKVKLYGDMNTEEYSMEVIR